MQGKTKTHRRPKGVIITLLICVLSVLGAGIIAAAVFLGRYGDCRMDMSLMEEHGDGVSKLYFYRDGEAVEVENGGFTEMSRYKHVSYDDIPKELKNAFVAIEDKRFYHHCGVDYLRTSRAGLNYLKGSRRSFGASTITQQLVKNLTGRDEYTLDRKFTEIFEALDLERQADKDQILEAYLNIINLANRCRGVGAAAELYFGKEPNELTLAECACIAAITNNPAVYDPIKHPDNNRIRAVLILDQMLEQGYITKAEYDSAVSQKISLCDTCGEGGSGISSWYADMVAQDVIKDLVEKYGYSRAHASRLLCDGGLSIYTAMSPDIQKILEEYYNDTDNFPLGDNGPQSAMMVLDFHTGAILGVAGAIGDKKGNRIQNYATDTRRPAGSVIKPLSVYAPALEEGIINWGSVYDDVPVRFEPFESGDKSENKYIPWPRNADNIYRGYTDIERAIADSVNTVAVRVLDELGMDRSFDFLKNRLHMSSLVGSTNRAVNDLTEASLALGQQSRGVSLRELLGGYTIFENGVYHKPISYYKVVDRHGTVLLDNTGQTDISEIVLSCANATIMTRLLMEAVRDGTAKKITLDDELDTDVAGKTGTTQNNCDRWFIGYTPRLLAGVWLGYDYPAELAGIDGNPCIGIWDNVMKRCEKEYHAAPQPRFDFCPAVYKLTYCADSGKIPCHTCLADPRTSRLKDGWFAQGNEPAEVCDRHISVDYDTVLGGISTGACPKDTVRKVALIRAKRSFPMQIYVRDAQYVWRGNVTGNSISYDPALPYFTNDLLQGEYCGISYGKSQYNRACASHRLE